jgi:hypothetical protein
MPFRIALLTFAVAASIVATACDKPSPVSPPASPQVRPHDQSAENILALFMALRKEKKEPPPHGESEPKHSADAEKSKPFSEPAPEKFDKAG